MLFSLSLLFVSSNCLFLKCIDEFLSLSCLSIILFINPPLITFFFVAENLKYYRAKTGLSQLKFAIQLEISPSYLNDIESGRQYASLKMLERMAKEFNIAPYQLLLPKDIPVQTAVLTEYENKIRTLKEQVAELFDKCLEP